MSRVPAVSPSSPSDMFSISDRSMLNDIQRDLNDIDTLLVNGVPFSDEQIGTPSEVSDVGPVSDDQLWTQGCSSHRSFVPSLSQDPQGSAHFMTPPYGLAPSSRVAATLPHYYTPATSSLGDIYQGLNDLETLLPEESVENSTQQPGYLQDCIHDPMIARSAPQDDQPPAAGTREIADVARPHSAHTHDTTSAKGLSRNDMIRADYGVNNTLTQALRKMNNDTSLPSSSVLHQPPITSDDTQTSTTIAPHAQISSKLNMKRLTTEYVSTRGLTQQHFEHAMHPTFTGSHVKLKRYQTPGGTTYGLEHTGPLQDGTIWPTDEPEPGRSNIQVQWSCSVSLDSRNLTAVPDVDDEGSLTVQSITRNSFNPFKPVKHKSGNGTVLYKIRQAFMDEIGAQMSSAKATKIPTSLISYERSVKRVMGYQGSITSKAGSRGRQTKLTVPLQVEVSLAFSAKS